MKVKDLPKRIQDLFAKEHEVGIFANEDICGDTKIACDFSWANSEDGEVFWDEINKGNFKPFYKKYGFCGEIEGFPYDIVMKMCERQVEQGNKWSVEVFEYNNTSDLNSKGFVWRKTPEGLDFWKGIIVNKKFDIFYNEYKNTKPSVLELNIPDGCELDLDASTRDKIVLKKKEVDIKTYHDLIKAKVNSGGYYISNGEVKHSNSSTHPDVMLYPTEREALRARAALIIANLMPYYGGAITHEEWSDSNMYKYIITRTQDYTRGYCTSSYFHELAFRTPELRDEFMKHNESLIKDYFMID